MYHIIAQHVARHVARHVASAATQQTLKNAVKHAPDVFQALLGLGGLASGADAASNLYNKLFNNQKKQGGQ